MATVLGEGTTLPETGVAALRAGIGVLIASLHGWHKVVQGWGYITTGAEWPLLSDTMAMGFPLAVVFAAGASLTQFVGGVLLAVGLFTRASALLLSATLVTAVVFNVQSSGGDTQLAGVYALASGAFVLIGGGGRFSLDAYLRSGTWPMPRRTQSFEPVTRSAGMTQR